MQQYVAHSVLTRLSHRRCYLKTFSHFTGEQLSPSQFPGSIRRIRGTIIFQFPRPSLARELFRRPRARETRGGGEGHAARYVTVIFRQLRPSK